VLSIFVSLLWGIISDHSSNRWGKRTPSIIMGALLAFPMIWLPALIFGILLTQLTRTTFEYLFILSAILFLVGALVFSKQVTQDAVEERLQANLEEMSELTG
jgi:Na+/melibiose symporter-like transporter